MSSNKQKGTVFIGLNRKPVFYQSMVREQFRDSKNIELRALGRAIPRAIQIAEKFVFNKQASYSRLISERIDLEGKDNILDRDTRERNDRENRERQRERDRQPRNHEDRRNREQRDQKESREPQQRTLKEKKKYVEKSEKTENS